MGKRDLILIILGRGISPQTKFFFVFVFFIFLWFFNFFFYNGMRDDLCTYESDDDDDDSTVAAAAAAAVVDAAEPAAELLPLGGRLPATPPQPVLI